MSVAVEGVRIIHSVYRFPPIIILCISIKDYCVKEKPLWYNSVIWSLRWAKATERDFENTMNRSKWKKECQNSRGRLEVTENRNGVRVHYILFTSLNIVKVSGQQQRMESLEQERVIVRKNDRHSGWKGWQTALPCSICAVRNVNGRNKWRIKWIME